MPIKPTQLGVKFLFEQNHTFEVPKYQRGYAWDEDAIVDFIEDLSRCLKVREEGSEKTHFFGGVVTVYKQVAKSNRSNYEVIDGQQRLASFVMFIAAIIRGVRGIIDNLTNKFDLSPEERKAKKFLEDTNETLRTIYLIYRDEIDLEYVEVPKLKLSDADDEFFQNIIGEKKAVSNRASHERIRAAWDKLGKFVENNLLKGGSSWAKAKRLQILLNSVLATDCSVIFMCSKTRSEAYQIFQVLNDRGVHLTDGDLLRASTLELLDNKDLLTIQNKLSERWDSVLSYAPGDIDKYLRWQFSSHEAKRPKSSNLADQFLEYRFKCKDKTSVDKAGAQAILEEVERIDRDFLTLKSVGDGEWPYEDHSTVMTWDRERLRMLIVQLKHTNAMPLLLSLKDLGPKKFAEAVAILERFVFRYKIIGKAHTSPMENTYLRHAEKIRVGEKNAIKNLRSDLRELICSKVPDNVFKANLSELRYSQNAGNRNIRYLLIVLEEFAQWYENGANGIPKCKDKTRIFDFHHTTLEHVYPCSAKDTEKTEDLEKVKHTLGNLTIFSPGDNDKAANKSFTEKCPILQASNLKLNRDIGSLDDWTAKKIEQRTQEIVNMSLKIFVP